MSEIEAKFAEINSDELREKLLALGFECLQPEKLMRRKILFLDENNINLYGRVRDEGNRITMTIKNITDGNSIHGVQESEVIINDFEKGVSFMEMAGWRVKAYQETKRETWYNKTKEVEVVIDTWPGIPTFCEIEADNENAVKQAAVELGFDWSKAFFGAVDVLYLHHLQIPYDVINLQTPIITFENPPVAFLSA